MKTLSRITLVALFALLAATAHAIIVGYAAYLVFEDGTIIQPAGETRAQCEANRDRFIAQQAALGNNLDESRSITGCRAIDETLPEIPPSAVKLLPRGPSCLSCPLLNEKTIGIFFPERANIIRELFYKYQIDMYNWELRSLQKRYDLDGFGEQVYLLQHSKKKQ